MSGNKVRLVIDTGVFIPCGDKSEDIVNSIKKFGNKLPELAEKVDIVISLSTEILGEYRIIPSKVSNCHPLPKFHASFERIFDRIQRYGRHNKCKERKIGRHKHMFVHIIESGKIGEFDVSEFVNDPEDEKFLKLALAEASKGTVFLLSVDRSSLLKLRDDPSLYEKFCNKFQYASNIKITLPGEFIDILRTKNED